MPRRKVGICPEIKTDLLQSLRRLKRLIKSRFNISLSIRRAVRPNVDNNVLGMRMFTHESWDLLDDVQNLGTGKTICGGSFGSDVPDDGVTDHQCRRKRLVRLNRRNCRGGLCGAGGGGVLS